MNPIDFADICGQDHVKRGLEVAAAGGHHVFLEGPPGMGKTMLITAMLGLLPEEAEVIRHDLAVPGPILFPSDGAETSDDPWMVAVEDWPCPCGWHGDSERSCGCSVARLRQHLQRRTAALRDRIDLYLEVPRVSYDKLISQHAKEPSQPIRHRVLLARSRQRERFASHPFSINAAMRLPDLRIHCRLDSAGQSLMKAAARQLSLSARSYHHTLKVARTIADLAHQERIGPAHLAEALQYRHRRRSPRSRVVAQLAARPRRCDY